MSNFIIQKDGFTSYTCVSNCFIERYMPKAPGEFVKIYIYLLKCIEEEKTELSISKIADAFEDTQKDVIRAMKYWEKKGLLKLSFDGKILTSLKLVSLSNVPSEENLNARVAEKVVVNITPSDETASLPKNDSDATESIISEETSIPEKKAYTLDEASKLMENDEISQLIYVVQQYLGRTLTESDLDSILYFYDGLKLPLDVIDYLFEYCVSLKKKNMRYIEKTAINWAERGITSVNAAKSLNVIYNENAYPVMNAFGLSGRKPSKNELSFIEKWSLSYGFSTEVITLACDRTISSIHQPSFEYADAILKTWKSAGAMNLKDIEKLDEERAKKIAEKTESQKQISKKTIKHDYIQHNYNYSEIAKALTNKC